MKKNRSVTKNFLPKNKKGDNLLTENMIFIILNLVFLVILILFIYLKMDDPSVFEEKYSKEIALMLDAAKPGMEIYYDLDFSDGDEEWLKGNFADSVTLQDNVITVKLREKGGYSYSTFSGNALLEVNPSGRVTILVNG